MLLLKFIWVFCGDLGICMIMKFYKINIMFYKVYNVSYVNIIKIIIIISNNIEWWLNDNKFYKYYFDK